MNKAIFLDRDGTLIEEKPYICHLSQSFIFPFTPTAITQMNHLQFKVIVISNQSAIARGICTPSQVEQIHTDITSQLLGQGAKIDKFYYCPYHPQGTIPQFTQSHPWRKPETGMILQAARDFSLLIPDCYMIGDDLCDVKVGLNAGCKTILVLSGKGQETREKLKQEGLTPHLITENILTATQWIANHTP